jgi:hypothetical protein
MTVQATLQIPWDSIVTLIAVGIGWLLAQSTDLVKTWQKRKTIKKALVNELSIIRKAFSDALERGEHKRWILDEEYPFITEVYDSIKIELASFLKLDSLAKVQRTYKEIKKLSMGAGDHTVMGLSLNHLFPMANFNKFIKLIDDAITQLK